MGFPALKGNILLCFGPSCMRSSWPWPHSASLSPDFSAGLSPSPSIILSPTAAVIPLSSSLHSSRTALPYLEHLPQCLPSLFPEPRPRARVPWPGQCSLPHTPRVNSVSPGFMFPQASCSAIPGSSQLFFLSLGHLVTFLSSSSFSLSLSTQPNCTPSSSPSPGPGYSSVFAPGTQHTHRGAGSHQQNNSCAHCPTSCLKPLHKKNNSIGIESAGQP